MASIIFTAAFVCFLFMSPSSEKPPVAYQPKQYFETKKAYHSSEQTKIKLKKFIKSSNPSIAESEVNEISYWIDEYATKENIDPMLVAALIDRESSFRKRAVSKTGAKGLGQIKDFNYKSLGIKDPYSIKQNIRGTVKYLKELKGMWKGSNESTRLVLASYYQGPNATKKKQSMLPKKVNGYVDDIMARYRKLSNN